MKKLIPLMLMAIIMSCTFAFAEPLAHLETKDGTVDVLSYDIVNEKGKTVLVMVYEWNSTADTEWRASDVYWFEGYQDGKQVPNVYSLDETPAGCEKNYTKIQPGYSIRTYTGLELVDDSPIDVTLGSFFDMGSVSFTLDLSNPSAENESEDISLEDRLAACEAKIAELEERLAALENK